MQVLYERRERRDGTCGMLREAEKGNVLVSTFIALPSFSRNVKVISPPFSVRGSKAGSLGYRHSTTTHHMCCQTSFVFVSSAWCPT